MAESKLATRPFRNEYVSVSRLKVFDQCPLRFFFSYVDKREPGISDKSAAIFGTLCHAVLEAIYHWVQEEEHSGVIPEDLIREVYDQQWTRSGLTGEELFAEGQALVISYFNRNPDVDCWDVLAVEQKFEIEIGGIKVLGFMDRVDRDGSDGIAIVDYKTNAMPYTREELATDLQASVYAIAAPKLWPWAKRVSFRFEMLRHDMVQKPDRSAADLELASRYIVAVTKSIEDPERKEWPAKVGPLCAWCEHRSSCDAYKRALAEDPVMHPVSDEDLAAVSAERERLKALISPVDARKKQLDRILTKHIEEKGTLELGQYTYRLIKIPRTEYTAEIIETLAKHSDLSVEQVAERVTVIDKKAVEKLVSDIKAGMTGQGSRAQKAMLSMDVEACKEVGFAFGRLDGRLNANALREKAGTQALPEGKADPEKLACDFCGKEPANLVERGGQRFAVCEDHKRKRKPPKAV